MRDASPLRYPGGKWRLGRFLEKVITLNRLTGCHYVEPYAGGGSLALSLLFANYVADIHLNDLDPAIHAFWHSVLKRNRDFVQLMNEVPITPDEWTTQKAIYTRGMAAGRFALGFATFFLNRTNHSGILNGGMIGGKDQTGRWKLDARFNRPELQRRIERIGAFRTRIHLSGNDATDFIRNYDFAKRSLVYLDPPYYQAGRHLYMNAYETRDHVSLKACVDHLGVPWMVSYDNVPPIRQLYKRVRARRLQLTHTARSARTGREVIFFAPGLRIPWPYGDLSP